jgi:hypothetical protein
LTELGKFITMGGMSGAGQVDGWVTLAAAARRFNVKHDRLKRAAFDGRLPARKLDEGPTSPYIARIEDVGEFLRTSRRGPKRKRREGDGA